MLKLVSGQSPRVTQNKMSAVLNLERFRYQKEKAVENVSSLGSSSRQDQHHKSGSDKENYSGESGHRADTGRNSARPALELTVSTTAAPSGRPS